MVMCFSDGHGNGFSEKMNEEYSLGAMLLCSVFCCYGTMGGCAGGL